jgi:hypothetical protein
MPDTWYSLAWGHPDPTYTHAGPRFETEQAAILARDEKQSEELPPEEGGAKWHALKIQRLP